MGFQAQSTKYRHSPLVFGSAKEAPSFPYLNEQKNSRLFMAHSKAPIYTHPTDYTEQRKKLVMVRRLLILVQLQKS